MAISDYIIILVCIGIGALFILFSTDKVYKYYLGLIFGFLIFLVINLQIKVLLLSGNGKEITGFLGNNKDFVLGFSASMIPIFGLFSVFNDNEATNRPILSFIFGLFIPIFLLSAFSFILVNSSIKLDFVVGIMSIFEKSTIFSFFKSNTKYIFYLIISILFWRFIVTLFGKFFLGIYQTSVEYFKKIKNLKK